MNLGESVGGAPVLQAWPPGPASKESAEVGRQPSPRQDPRSTCPPPAGSGNGYGRFVWREGCVQGFFPSCASPA